MQTRGDKFLLVFLALGILTYVLTIPRSNSGSIDSIGASTSEEEDTSTVTMGPQAHMDSGMNSLESYQLGTEGAQSWELPKELREISGLAVDNQGHLWAHGDEAGIVFELDYKNRSIMKSFALSDGTRPIADDFEGIAAADSLIYMVTSAGRIYEFREAANGQSVLYTLFTTGVGRDFEIEGLAYQPERKALLLMSKAPLNDANKGLLKIFEWSIDTKQLVDDAEITIPISQFSRQIPGRSFHPSGIERHPASGHYFVVAAQENAIAEITPHGAVIAVIRFPQGTHPQAEGITFAHDNTLIVSDEGGKGQGRLTFYPVSENR
jgi:uncharacterized protein YjiK